MHISKYIIRGAIIAEYMRQRIARDGHVNGHPLWTGAEDAVVRQCYPNYSAARRKLRRRSYWAIRHRAETLNIQRKRHIWTGADIVRLRKIYPGGSKADLLTAFPGVTLNAITKAANRKRIVRARRNFKPTGHPLLDNIRARCTELGYSMVDLDAVARTKKYFQCAQWQSNGKFSVTRLSKAVVALGGELSASWIE